MYPILYKITWGDSQLDGTNKDILALHSSFEKSINKQDYYLS